MPFPTRTALNHRLLGVVLCACMMSAACSGDAAVTSTTAAPTTTAADTVDPPIVNVWTGRNIDQTALPLGSPAPKPLRGGLFACPTGPPRGVPFPPGPWIDQAGGTWDASEKVAVRGELRWSRATYIEEVVDEVRRIRSNGLPVDTITGDFPIDRSDPAATHDRNPNQIAQYELSIELPLAPELADEPACLPRGPIGIMGNGVALYSALDDQRRDAVAHETQDACDGHPDQRSRYHYHAVPSCMLAAATGPSTVVGWAFDGHPIVVERDRDGRLPTNADLDECHGRTSPVVLDGELVTAYHYSVTREFPYVVGCFRSAPAVPESQR
jgi:hypothetical protein